ncbi:MAG: hypothetical protein AABX71_01865 [Nanoarchaeota archaeon]
MKKTLFTAIVLSLLCLPLTAACVNPTDSFASEVVLNKPETYYNLGRFLKAENFLYEDGRYIFQSQYNKNLATILSEISSPVCKTNCLSVRLQIPLDEAEFKSYYLSVISSVVGKEISLKEETDNYKGWSIISGKTSLELKKNQINILISSLDRRSDIIIEINEKLKICGGCDGKCVYTAEGNKCITREMKEDIEEIMKFLGLINKFSDLFSSYRAVEAEKTIADLKPAIEPYIDWEEAMKQELVNLKAKGIIDIEDKDIEKIAWLSERGRAGHNSRIVYSEKDREWKYYYDTENPVLIRGVGCEEFPAKNLPRKALDFRKLNFSTYYLIPGMIAFFLAVIFVILYFIARKITKMKGKRRVKRIKQGLKMR